MRHIERRKNREISIRYFEYPEDKDSEKKNIVIKDLPKVKEYLHLLRQEQIEEDWRTHYE